MADNKQIKDGLGNLFNLRMRDVAPAQDGTLMRSVFDATAMPHDYGTGGMYQHAARSGLMAAGLAASSPIYAFCFQSGTLLACVRRVKVSVASVGAFTAGLATFNLFVARGFTAQDGGGAVIDLSGNHAKLRTSMATAAASISCATTAALTAGTRTLDPDPADSLTVAAPGTGNAVLALAAPLLSKAQGEHPLLLAQNEGFVIRATVPAAGTWQFAVTAEWDEVQVF